MRNEEIKKITEQLENGIHEMFESDKWAEYLNTMAKLHHYSVNNSMLIYFQNPNATLVQGYKAWQTKFKRQVKKGEKAIKILAPCPHQKTIATKDEDGNDGFELITWTSFRVVNVFDISQTEGEDIKGLSVVKPLDGKVKGYKTLLGKLKKFSPVPIGFEEIKGGANGYFNLVEKRIAIKDGMSQQQTIKTTIHEIAHALLHNLEDGEEKEADRRTAEVQAESIAYTVCSYLGLDTSEYSFGYVTGWSSGKEAKELIDSMETIRKTANTIIEACA